MFLEEHYFYFNKILNILLDLFKSETAQIDWTHKNKSNKKLQQKKLKRNEAHIPIIHLTHCDLLALCCSIIGCK